MEQLTLNLARKWRSKRFKEIVGQDLVVRVLQNSLFKNAFFPVYLLSGQRGCGKTSTARVFAAAMNCQKLDDFQKDPKSNVLPCLRCDSCIAMMHVRHPDFVEIDAASYTGVDNIRNIIDTSSFLPVLSKRKVYLIDEVHMLSKAAFNAFLKILEEPPSFVVFILATTEIHKLPETVKSRCFQLFFNAIEPSIVVGHLQNMCEQESIVYEQSALGLIARVSQGSLRDAINVLEQARFASDKITKQVVCMVLGYLDDQYIYNVLMCLLKKDQEALLKAFGEIEHKSISADYFLQRLQELAYDTVMIYYKAPIRYFVDMADALQGLVQEVDISDLIYCFDALSTLSEDLSKTSKKQLLFESRLMAIIFHSLHDVEKKKIRNLGELGNTQEHYQQIWKKFIESVKKVVDPILYSMFCESEFKAFDNSEKIVRLETLKKFVMFQDLFIEQKSKYQDLLDRYFVSNAILIVDFKKQDFKENQKRKLQQVPSRKHFVQDNSNVSQKIDISDEKKWKLANALLKHFGGTLSEIVKEKHEPDA